MPCAEGADVKELMVVALLVFTACSGSPGDQSASLCAALASLGGNNEDFKTLTTASRPEDALAARDRMSARARSAIAALEAIPDGPVGTQASRLAAVEQGLLPFLDRFGTVTDNAGFNAAVDEYTRWYDESLTVISDVTAELNDLGVRCG